MTPPRVVTAVLAALNVSLRPLRVIVPVKLIGLLPPTVTELLLSVTAPLTTSGTAAWIVPPVSVYEPVPALFAAKVSVPLFNVLVPVTPLLPDRPRLPGPVTVSPAVPVTALLMLRLLPLVGAVLLVRMPSLPPGA